MHGGFFLFVRHMFCNLVKAELHAFFYQFHGFCGFCTNLRCRNLFGETSELKEEVFHNMWETLWKARQINGFFRVFHRENLFFLWKTFSFPVENFFGNKTGGEKTQNAQNILTA